MATSIHVPDVVYASDMLSFSFNPEILSFFGERNADFVLERANFNSPLTSLKIIISPVQNSFTVFSLLHYSVVASGVVVLVGIGSYCAYHKVQQVSSGYNDFKITLIGWSNRITNTIFNLIRRAGAMVPNRLSTLYSERAKFDAEHKNIKKPSDLQISSNCKGSGHELIHVMRQKSDIRANAFKCDLTPTITDMAMGDEDVEEVQCQYFGPVGVEIQRIVDDVGEGAN